MRLPPGRRRSAPVHVTVRLPASVAEAARSEALRLGVPVAQVLREIITEHFAAERAA